MGAGGRTSTGEETNIDVLWATTDGVRTFCEVKLSEADFGKLKLFGTGLG